MYPHRNTHSTHLNHTVHNVHHTHVEITKKALISHEWSDREPVGFPQHECVFLDQVISADGNIVQDYCLCQNTSLQNRKIQVAKINDLDHPCNGARGAFAAINLKRDNNGTIL